MRITERLKKDRNVFTRRPIDYDNYGPSSSNNSRRIRPLINKSTITASLFTRIAIDASSVEMLHVKIDKATENQEIIQSGINNCLNTEANIDQSSIAFIHDMVYSILDEGVIAIVPVETTYNPEDTDAYDINQMRIGKITQWYPRHVKIQCYNELTGLQEEITLSKNTVAIVENPLYEVVNSRNGTLDRLRKKIQLLDREDEARSSGRLDLIFQFKHALKTEAQKQDAQNRIRDLEEQLKNNSHGISYIGETEKFTQLNRPIENNLQEQISELTIEFFNQIGLTKNILDGTADESEMRGYYTRTVDPIIDRIMAEMKRVFLSKTARTQGQTLIAYRDPFKLVPVDQIANVADTFRRNSILTSNEFRRIVGYGPDPSPEADLLFNPNISAQNQFIDPTGSPAPPDIIQNGGNY